MRIAVGNYWLLVHVPQHTAPCSSIAILFPVRQPHVLWLSAMVEFSLPPTIVLSSKRCRLLLPIVGREYLSSSLLMLVRHLDFRHTSSAFDVTLFIFTYKSCNFCEANKSGVSRALVDGPKIVAVHHKDMFPLHQNFIPHLIRSTTVCRECLISPQERCSAKGPSTVDSSTSHT